MRNNFFLPASGDPASYARPIQSAKSSQVLLAAVGPARLARLPYSWDAVRYLQRTVGNAAVVTALSGPPVVQRDAQIHVDQGTTDELEAELVRLRGERDKATDGRDAFDRPISRVMLLLAERRDNGKGYSSASLGFDGRRLSLSGPSSVSFPAVSGRPMADGSFDYSRERQHQENRGPIPAGDYWLDPDQMTDLRWHLFVSESSWGTHRITIHPAAGTPTFGRGGFFIHGGSTPGSAGCIDLTSNDAAFAEALAKNVSSGSRIGLTVNYPELGDYPRRRSPDQSLPA